MNIAVIGAGIAGLSIAQLLKDNNNVTVYESDSRPGGLIKCDRIDGNLFHRTGGHVFNTKRQDVLNFFWSFFDKDREFAKSLRHAAVDIPGTGLVDYPIENHVYQLGPQVVNDFVNDMAAIMRNQTPEPQNFEDFLRQRFGETLYQLYFKPYNHKVWRRDLSQVPLSWLDGKLPMPSPEEMLYRNISHEDERQFVHSQFYYPVSGGSQFIADRLAHGLDLRLNTPITHIERLDDGKWLVNGEIYDKVVYCGNVKQLPKMLDSSLIGAFAQDIDKLESHGTTTVFCQINPNDYSWIYQPSTAHQSHRIICTGNFAPANNAPGMMTATVEFTDEVSPEETRSQLASMPFKPKFLAYNYEKYTYPIQSEGTRPLIGAMQQRLNAAGMYLLGRFAQWEYFNMDAAMGAAIDIAATIAATPPHRR